MNQTGAFALATFLPYRLNRQAEAVSDAFFKGIRKRFGFSWTEWECFCVIGEMRETTATEIVRQTAMHKTKVSRAIAGLEGRGLVERKTHINDKRVEIITLTPQGTAAYVEMARFAMTFETELFGSCGEKESETVRKGLDCIQRCISEFDPTKPAKPR